MNAPERQAAVAPGRLNAADAAAAEPAIRVRSTTAEPALESASVDSQKNAGASPASAARAQNAPESSQQHPAIEAGDLQEVWLAIGINGEEPADTTLVLRRKDGRLLMRAEDFKRWRLRVPTSVPLLHSGETYFPLDGVAGLSYELDQAAQALLIKASPAVFEGTVLRRAYGLTIPKLPPLGGFLNYDLFVNHAQGDTVGSGLLEAGAFGRFGAAVSSFLARDLGLNPKYVRLDSTWTQDRPEDLASLRLGDAISRASVWARPVRFGGVQWATNFATQPGFVTFPLPALTGEAVLPSTVDLYVNDALRLRREVPSGPFSIPDLPVITGQGEARLVVRDLLGRERIISQPYYATPRLLRAGLHDYSYELGFARRNFGFESNDYGRLLAVGTHRLGVTERFTAETHGELLEDQQTIGVGGAYLWTGTGLFSGSVAASHNERGAGALIGAGFERQTRTLSFGANTQVTTEHFTQLGLQPFELAPKQLSQAFASLATASYGSFGINYVHQGYRDRDDVDLISASYSVSVGKAALGVSLIRFVGGDGRTVLGVTLTIPLDARTSASVSTTAQRGSQQALFQVQRNLPSGTGVGYRLLGGIGDSERLEAGVTAQNEIGTYTVEAARTSGDTAVRASVSGGVAAIGGQTFLSRRIADSFAVVRMPDYPNVRIYADNQLVARTGSDGSALVPRLRAYEKNSIRIEQSDLPLDAQIDAMQIDAVPYYRSGLLLEFPVKRSRGALLTVVLDNNEPLPPGAVAQIVGEAEEFPVGLKGEVYVTGLAANNRLRFTWRGQSCELPVAFPDTSEPVPHLGTFTCSGVQR